MHIIPEPRTEHLDDTRPDQETHDDSALPRVEFRGAAAVVVFPPSCDWPQQVRDRFVVALRAEILLSVARRRPPLDLPAPTATAARMLAGAR